MCERQAQCHPASACPSNPAKVRLCTTLHLLSIVAQSETDDDNSPSPTLCLRQTSFIQIPQCSWPRRPRVLLLPFSSEHASAYPAWHVSQTCHLMQNSTTCYMIPYPNYMIPYPSPAAVATDSATSHGRGASAEHPDTTAARQSAWPHLTAKCTACDWSMAQQHRHQPQRQRRPWQPCTRSGVEPRDGSALLRPVHDDRSTTYRRAWHRPCPSRRGLPCMRAKANAWVSAAMCAPAAITQACAQLPPACAGLPIGAALQGGSRGASRRVSSAAARLCASLAAAATAGRTGRWTRRCEPRSAGPP